jgi:hypothetical protein
MKDAKMMPSKEETTRKVWMPPWTNLNTCLRRNYLPWELSALGLHLDKSANFRAGDIDAKDTRMSFIPSDLLLEAQEAVAEAKPSNLPLPKALPPMDVITPKLEYTKQYRGLRLETIPPPAFSHPKVQNEAGRRRSIHTRRTEMAVCA